LNLRAYRLEQDGRYLDALADLKHARALSPRDVPTLNALGLASPGSIARPRRWKPSRPPSASIPTSLRPFQPRLGV